MILPSKLKRRMEPRVIVLLLFLAKKRKMKKYFNYCITIRTSPKKLIKLPTLKRILKHLRTAILRSQFLLSPKRKEPRENNSRKFRRENLFR